MLHQPPSVGMETQVQPGPPLLAQHFGQSQVEEGHPEGQRNTAVFQKRSCGEKPGHFREEVTFKLSWRKQVHGQGHGILGDIAGGTA